MNGQRRRRQPTGIGRRRFPRAALIAGYLFAVAARSPESFRSSPQLDVSQTAQSSLPDVGKSAELRDSDLALQAPEFHPIAPWFPRTDRLSLQPFRSSKTRSSPRWGAEELRRRQNDRSSAVRRHSSNTRP